MSQVTMLLRTKRPDDLYEYCMCMKRHSRLQTRLLMVKRGRSRLGWVSMC